MTVGELRAIMEQYADDVEVCLGGAEATRHIAGTYDDEGEPDERILVLDAGDPLPPM